MSENLEHHTPFTRRLNPFREAARRRAAVTLPVTLDKRRVYILPTRMGYGFAVVLFVMLIGSLNYNNNLGFLFTFLLMGMSFISMFHTHGNLSGLTLISIRPKPVFAGDDAVFTLTIRPASPEHMAIMIKAGSNNEYTLHFSGNSDHRIDIAVKTSERGMFTIPPVTVSTTYPLGLFRAWSTLITRTEYLVYPKPEAGPMTTTSVSADSDNDGITEIAGIDDFKELRRYIPGDQMTRISWKTYSRGRGVFTKTFTGHAGTSVLFDWNTLKQGTIENRLSRLCDMILQAHDRNLSYGLHLPGRLIDAGEPKDYRHRHECLKALALFGTKGDTKR